MELDAITSKLVERALSAWSRAEDPPAELLELEFLGPGGSARRRLALHAFCLSTVQHYLVALREKSEIPTFATQRRDDLRRQLEEDFCDSPLPLQGWSALYHRYLEPNFRLSVAELERVASCSESVFRERVMLGVRLLTEALQQAEGIAHQQRQQASLPLREYQELVGIEDLSENVVALLEHPDNDSLISIEGLGGIGKTTLAYRIAQHLNRSQVFASVLWVSARQRWLDAAGQAQENPKAARTLTDIVETLLHQLGLDMLSDSSLQGRLDALRRVCSDERYCVILDNLESVGDVEHVVPTLYQHCGRSRLLVTSRRSLRHLPFVVPVAVPELSLEDSQRLVESTLRYRAGFQHAPGETPRLSPALMERLYTLAGGVPLALKLIVSQPLPLADVLDDLARMWDASAAQDVESLRDRIFDHVYRRAWEFLSPASRDLLISMMDVAPEGEDVDWLRMVSGLTEAQFRPALDTLLRHSLVEMGGDLEMPYFRLHRLTVTFLETQMYRGYQSTLANGANSERD